MKCIRTHQKINDTFIPLEISVAMLSTCAKTKLLIHYLNQSNSIGRAGMLLDTVIPKYSEICL